jgi:RimJ/RimL family protein N-acetyltransferase
MYKKRLVMEFTFITEKDLKFVNEVRNDCAPFLHDPRTFTLEETKEWFKTEPQWWIIWHEGKRIGYFRTSNYYRNFCFIGADLHKDYRGKGLGYQCYQEFMPILSSHYAVNRFLLEVLESNKRAIALYEKLGFQYVIGGEEVIERNGVREGSYLMAKTWNIL